MLVNWLRHAEPSDELKKRLILKDDSDPLRRIYEVDGERLMENRLDGTWWLYHEGEEG